MIGFWISYGGVQVYFGVILDFMIMGKVIGGGFFVGVYGGCVDIMGMVVFVGLMYQVGIFSGNFLVMIVGIKILELFKQFGIYEKLMVIIQKFVVGIKDVV